MRKFTQEALRGSSAWSVGDRELMVAFVSKMNECEFCIGAHAAVAARAYHDEAKVSAVLSDLETAPIEEPLRATLRMLGKLTREHVVDADDIYDSRWRTPRSSGSRESSSTTSARKNVQDDNSYLIYHYTARGY